ncbi:unnamed protein product, partial [Iphiclides podalirius]
MWLSLFSWHVSLRHRIYCGMAIVPRWYRDVGRHATAASHNKIVRDDAIEGRTSAAAAPSRRPQFHLIAIYEQTSIMHSLFTRGGREIVPDGSCRRHVRVAFYCIYFTALICYRRCSKFHMSVFIVRPRALWPNVTERASREMDGALHTRKMARTSPTQPPHGQRFTERRLFRAAKQIKPSCTPESADPLINHRATTSRNIILHKS